MSYKDKEKQREYNSNWVRQKYSDPEAREKRRIQRKEYRERRKKELAEYNKEWAENNSDKITLARLNRLKDIKTKHQEYKQSVGCIVCGENELCTLDFHHLNPEDKEYNIGTMIVRGMSWENILLEIEKCIVLCSNCHRKLHAGIINLDQIV